MKYLLNPTPNPLTTQEKDVISWLMSRNFYYSFSKYSFPQAAFVPMMVVVEKEAYPLSEINKIISGREYLYRL